MSALTSSQNLSPQVSVVMAVFNGQDTIQQTVDSILNQTLADFEFIIIDDGSTDCTVQLLQGISSKDNRVQVIRQENQGLTRSLIRGCKMAKGQYIARQDVGDFSLPQRLEQQSHYLDQSPDVSFCSVLTERMGPGMELLDTVGFPSDVSEATSLCTQGIRMPPHPSVMFRKSAYVACGGYRWQFRVAQDHDLWYRLALQGKFGCVRVPLFQYVFDASGISAQNKAAQQELAGLARKCFQARSQGESDERWLERAALVSNAPRPGPKTPEKERQAAFKYFVGSCLLKRRDHRSFKYLIGCLADKPFSLRVYMKLFLVPIRCLIK